MERPGAKARGRTWTRGRAGGSKVRARVGVGLGPRARCMAWIGTTTNIPRWQGPGQVGVVRVCRYVCCYYVYVNIWVSNNIIGEICGGWTYRSL